MSALQGKIKIDGIPQINGKQYIAMSFIQGRSSDWVKKPFFSEYDEKACWINELKPAFGEKTFFFKRDEIRSPDLDDINDEADVFTSAMAFS
jgi:hypothetical protein